MTRTLILVLFFCAMAALTFAAASVVLVPR